MDQKHLMFDSAVVGTLTIAVALLTLYWIHPVTATGAVTYVIEWVACRCCDTTTAVAKIAAFGAAVGTLGVVVRQASYVFHLNSFRDPYRKMIAKEIQKTACQSGCLPSELGARWAIDVEERPDPFFVWVQYSDPQPALREWGRTRTRDMYVAQTWSLGIVMGFAGGVAIGDYFLGLRPRELWWLAPVSLIPWSFFILCVMASLDRLIEHNRQAEQTMVSVYLAGILNKPLRDRFLKPLRKEK